MFEEVTKVVNNDDIDSAALRIMRRQETITPLKIAGELGLRLDSYYAIVKQNPSLLLYERCVRANWNEIIKQSQCLQAANRLLSSGREVPLAVNDFMTSTGLPGTFITALRLLDVNTYSLIAHLNTKRRERRRVLVLSEAL
ncbi:MAG: hypothetical protein WA021_05750, partial [Minisyncoccia bacterium]